MTDVPVIYGYQQAFEALCDKRLVQSMYSECDELMERVLLTLHGADHARRRAVELKLFRRDFTRYYEKEVYPATLSATLAPYLEHGRMDLHEFGLRVNINLSADIAGIDRDPHAQDETDCLLEIVRKFGEGATLFHSTRDKAEVRREVADALALLEARFLKPSRERRELILREIADGRLPEEAAPRDILTVLLANQTGAGSRRGDDSPRGRLFHAGGFTLIRERDGPLRFMRLQPGAMSILKIDHVLMRTRFFCSDVCTRVCAYILQVPLPGERPSARFICRMATLSSRVIVS